jgi:hypothetical protein
MTKSLLSKAADVGHAYQLARLLDDAAVNDDFQSSCTKRALHCLRRAAPSGPLASRPPQSSARFKNCRARFSASHPVSAMPTIARSSTENDNRLTPGGARMYARSDGVLQPRPDGCPSLCPANGLAFSGGSVPVSGPAGQQPGWPPWASCGQVVSSAHRSDGPGGDVFHSDLRWGRYTRTVEIRKACIEEAEQACAVVRRSITELCHVDHQGDAPTLSLWLANKTAENMRRWIAQTYVFVAAEQGQILIGT